MPTLAEIRQQRKALEAKYGQLSTVNVLTPPPTLAPPAEVEPPRTTDIVDRNLVPLTDAQVAALVAAGIKDRTNWQHQLDQAIGLYLDLREEMPEEEWGDKELPDDMRSELLIGESG